MEYQRTSKNENLLLYDSGFEERRIWIFGTKTNTEKLELAPIFLADGTFKTAPILFEQVYVIHALRGGPEQFENGHLLPSLFVLLTKKTDDVYMRMWEVIQQLCPGAQPTHMLMDFERAAINSFSHFWPHTTVKSCFFHFTHIKKNTSRRVAERIPTK